MGARHTRDASIAFIELENNSDKARDQTLAHDLRQALNWLEKQQGLDRVIIYGRGDIFYGNHGAKNMDNPTIEPHLSELLMRIEASNIPFIAAVKGQALGEGLELLLACHYRVVSQTTILGLPQVTLGLLPEAGGTQRLPRLIGLEPALDMIAFGKPIAAQKALELNLIHKIENDPLSFSTHLNLEEIKPELDKPTASNLPGPKGDPAVIEHAIKQAERKQKHQPAPLKAIECVALTCSLSFSDGQKKEWEASQNLRQSPQAKALRHVAIAEREAKLKGYQGAKSGKGSANIETVTVIGGGTMGAGIAYTLVSAGMKVFILETDEYALERARSNVEKIISTSVSRQHISQAQADRLHETITFDCDYLTASQNADLVIEAVSENMDIKRDIFLRLEDIVANECILATNTSYLDINQLSTVLKDPSRLLGLHFFAPAHIMKLLEIVKGKNTSDRALGVGFEIAKKLKKTPVLSGVCEGFIGNRILARYRESAEILLIDGSNPWDIDEVMTGFGYAMGPFEAQDLSGLDIAYANRQRQANTRDPKRRYVKISDRMCEEGRLGKKASVGWYRYPGGKHQVVDPLIEDLIREEAYFAGIERKEFSHAEIERRLILAMINEAADILHEGIAASSKDIDLVTILGYGFPRSRGGLMYYADQIGAEEILKQLNELSLEDPVIWKPSPLIVKLAKAGKHFSDI